jgi:hypothetical protein
MTADVSSGWLKLGTGLFCGFGLLPSASVVGKSPPAPTRWRVFTVEIRFASETRPLRLARRTVSRPQFERQLQAIPVVSPLSKEFAGNGRPLDDY